MRLLPLYVLSNEFHLSGGSLLHIGTTSHYPHSYVLGKDLTYGGSEISFLSGRKDALVLV